MPVTEYFGKTFTNNGPLTTTYTPPPSCTTVTTDQIAYANRTSVQFIIGKPTCEIVPLGKCLPSGSLHDKIAGDYDKHGGQGTYDYFSPGVVCPHGWTTAGTLAPGDKTGSADKSGVFTKDPFEQYPAAAANNLSPEKMWLDVLEPSETLAFCCPSGWVSGWQGCVSSIEPFESATYTNNCFRSIPQTAITKVFTVEGTTVPNGIFSIATGDVTPVTQAIESLPTYVAVQHDDLAIVRVLPHIAMVYKESDMKDSKDGGGDKGDDNGASMLRGVSLFPVIAVLFSVLFGAGLLMPRF